MIGVDLRMPLIPYQNIISYAFCSNRTPPIGFLEIIHRAASNSGLTGLVRIIILMVIFRNQAMRGGMDVVFGRIKK
jgi:hypothetical protein